MTEDKSSSKDMNSPTDRHPDGYLARWVESDNQHFSKHFDGPQDPQRRRITWCDKLSYFLSLFVYF